VKFKLYQEAFLDTDNELVAHNFLGVLFYFAQHEATKISSRTKAGLERVRTRGNTLGRLDGFAVHGPVLKRVNAKGYSREQISQEMGLTVNMVKSYLKRLETQVTRRNHLCANLCTL
jgi:DNA invertase Pin-like site-specific DNA recombinase